MKLLKSIILYIGTAAVCSIYISCSKEAPDVAKPVTNIGNAANIQVFNATVKATKNYIYVDDVPLSGAALAYGGVFPATAYSFSVSAGSHTFLIKDTSASTTQSPLSFTQSLDAGKSYTIFTYDTITSVKQSIVLNNIVIPTDTTCMLRFANFVYNTSPITNVDVYSTKKGISSPLFSNIATNQVTDFVAYPSQVVDTLLIYPTGTTSPLLLRATVKSLVPTRSYTAAFTGSYTGATSISTFANY